MSHSLTLPKTILRFYFVRDIYHHRWLSDKHPFCSKGSSHCQVPLPIEAVTNKVLPLSRTVLTKRGDIMADATGSGNSFQGEIYQLSFDAGLGFCTASLRNGQGNITLTTMEPRMQTLL